LKPLPISKREMNFDSTLFYYLPELPELVLFFVIAGKGDRWKLKMEVSGPIHPINPEKPLSDAPVSKGLRHVGKPLSVGFRIVLNCVWP